MALKYYTIPPPEYLVDYVRFFWVLETDTPFHIHRSMADVCPELIFHYKGRFDEIKSTDKKEKSFISGIHGQAKNISTFQIDESFGIFGVYLYPYALPVLFGIASTELTDQHIDLHSLFGNEGKELEEKMMLAENNYKRFDIINQYLQVKLNKHHDTEIPIVFSIQSVMQTKGLTKIKSLAQQSFLSERQFERKFKQFTGFSPKLFSRIVRFHAAFSQYNISSNKTLTEIALDCGYYDQSHFIQDFKIFSGHNPKNLFSGQAEGLEWMNV